jgi:MFS family permease
MSDQASDKRLFWACFISLIATAFGFITRLSLLNEWGVQFNLNTVQLGVIGGAGVWPFAISIILFSLIIDKIGYGKAMAFAFVAHVSYGIIVICAPLMLNTDPNATPEQVAAGQNAAYWMLYVGSFIFALGNGTVEAVINPVVATMFSKEKTKWLNILHAGWPGGLVIAGIIMISMGGADWRYKIALIFLPAVVYGVMMLGARFPVNERVAAGGTYKGMLEEFGVLAAVVVVALIVRQVCEVLGDIEGLAVLHNVYLQLGVGAALVIAFGAYTKSLGRPMLFFMMLIMIPLATTEIGTDGWITSLMEPQMASYGLHPAWVLVYTSFIMMVLRFFAGPIVHKLSPLGLLMLSAIIAAAGLLFLSKAAGISILVAATLYGFGKTFFWPTMLGVVSEQFPKGGALTLNAVGGVGMLAVGVLGFPFIGLLQTQAVSSHLEKQQPEVAAKVLDTKEGIVGKYKAIEPDKLAALTPKVEEAKKVKADVSKELAKKDGLPPSEDKLKDALASNAAYTAIIESPDYVEQAKLTKEVTEISENASKGALATMAIFPCIMLAAYVALFLYFKSQGGYKAQVLTGHAAEDKKFTGGINAPVEA